MNTLRIAILSLVLGMLGFALAFAGWHLWIDHYNFHAMLNQYVSEHAQPAPKVDAPAEGTAK